MPIRTLPPAPALGRAAPAATTPTARAVRAALVRVTAAVGRMRGDARAAHELAALDERLRRDAGLDRVPGPPRCGRPDAHRHLLPWTL